MMDRRRFLGTTAAVGAGTLMVGSTATPASAQADPASASTGRRGGPFPFTLGVASGDVTSRAVALWTRLAPEPLDADGGMGDEDVEVQWELAADQNFARRIATGRVMATAALGHSVHVTVDGLGPGRRYWYRFRANGHESRVGRTKTLPQGPTSRVRFATSSCQHWENGLFVAYQSMVRDDVDFVLHLGDYIYGVSRGDFRRHSDPEVPRTLDQYRVRHAQYKTDESLQAIHAAVPFLTTLDNHDALPDEAGDAAELDMRAAAYQAWYEHMPTRTPHRIEAASMPIYRAVDLGDLVSLNLVDSRQFRDPQDICTDEIDFSYGFGIYRPRCDEVDTPGRTTLGPDQTRWLDRRIATADATWNVMANTVLFSPFRFDRDGVHNIYESSWDAYPESQRHLLDSWAAAGSRNRVVLSGDIHSNWVIDIPADPTDPAGQPAGTEFLGTSITSLWPGPLDQPIADNLANNPHVKYYNGQERGYQVHTVTGREWRTELRIVDDTTDPSARARTAATWVVEEGRPGAQLS